MQRHSILFALSLLGTSVVGGGSALGASMGPGNPVYPYDPGTYGSPDYFYNYTQPGYQLYSYNYPPGSYNYNSGYSSSANPFAFLGGVFAAPFDLASNAAAPLVTGRSVATAQPGNFCSTPVRTCELTRTSFVGNGCSCHVHGGRARGSVIP